MATENEKKLETQIRDLTQERKKLESEILALKARINSEETKSVANIEKMVKLEALRLNNYAKEEEVRKKIEKIETDGLKRSEELNSLVEDNLDYSKEQNDLTGKLSFIKKGIVNQAERIKDEQSQSAALMGVVNKEGKTVLGTAAQQKDAYASITNYLQIGAESAGATTTQTQAYVKILEQAGETAADMLGYEDRILLAQEKQKQGIYETVDLSNLELSYKVTAAKFAQDAPNMTEAQRKSAQELLGVEGERLQVLRDANEALEKSAAKSGLLKDAMGGVNLSMSGLLDKIPSGDKIGKILNIDKTSNKMKKQFGEAFNAAVNEKNFGKAFAAAGGGLKSMIGLAGKFSAALGLGLLMGAADFLIGAFNKVDEEVAEIGNEFGISRKAATTLRDTSVDIAGEMGMVGINSKEVVKNIGAVSEMMGGLDIGSQLASGNPAVRQLVKDATLLTEKFGMSSDEVASMQTLSSITGKSMGELAGTAVKMGGGLMTSKQALKALAGVPKEVAVAFKGIPSALAAAAQKAKLLGHDLKKVQDIGDGMLDIEQSLEKEMEARVLTGKNLQLDKARELALNGDIAGLQDELLKQAGGLGEFTKMNRIQQKSMAEAMGMSVEEMTTMLSNADKLQKMGVSQKRLDEMQNMNAEQLRKLNQDGMNDVMKGEIEKMAKEKESAAIKERMSNIVTKLQEKLSKLLSPILEMVHGMLDATEAGGGFDEIIESISATVKGIIPIVKTVFSVMTALIKPVMSILEFITNIGSSTVQVKDAAGNLTEQVETVKSSFGGILGVVTAIGAAFAGKALLGKGMDMLKDKAADVGKSVLKNIGGSLSKVGGKFGKVAGKALGKGGGAKMPKMPGAKAAGGEGGGFMDSLVEAFNKIDAKKMIQGAAALVILSIALYITAKAVQEFMKTDWAAMAKAGVALLGLAAIAYLLSKAKSAMIQGAIAMIILGAALYIVGAALQLFTSIGWEDLAKAGVALLGLAGIAALLGAAAPLFLIGAGVLIVLSVALIVFAAAMWILGKAMEGVVPLMETAFNGISGVITTIGDAIVKIINAVAGGITGVIDKLMGLTTLDADNLLKIGVGITALGVAIAAFGGGAGIGAGLAGLGKLLGGESPIEQIVKITKELQPEKLTTAATAIVAMSVAMKGLQEALSKLDVDKMAKAIDKLNEMEVSKGAGAMLGGIGSAISSVFGGGKKEEVAAAGGGGGVKVEGQQTAGVAMAGVGGGVGGVGGGAGAAAGGGSMSGVEKKLDSLISIISGMSSTPTIIKIGDKTVEEINMKGDFKKTYQIGSDNTFGKAL